MRNVPPAEFSKLLIYDCGRVLCETCFSRVVYVFEWHAVKYSYG